MDSSSDPTNASQPVNIDQFRAAAREFREARQEFEAAKRPLIALPEWALGFWAAEDQVNVKVVSGEVLGRLIERLSEARRLWRNLEETASQNVKAQSESEFRSDVELEFSGSGSIADVQGRIDELDLLVEGSVDVFPVFPPDLYMFRLRRCLIDGNLQLSDAEIPGLLLLQTVKFVVSPARKGEVESLHQSAYEIGMTREPHLEPEALERSELLLDRAHLGGLKMDDVTAWLISGDECVVTLWVEFSALYTDKCSFETAAFRKSWTAIGPIDLGDFYADGAVFEGPTDFSGAHFRSLVMSRVQFRQAAYFRDVTFESAPVFHDAVFSSDTDFFGASFARPDVWTFSAALNARNAYRVLRLAMSKAKAHDEEMRFFELEERTTRSLMSLRREPVSKVLSAMYDWISCYGTSPGRALTVFLVWNGAFSALFALCLAVGPKMRFAKLPTGLRELLTIPATAIETSSHIFTDWRAAGLAIQNAINPLALVSSNAMIKVDNAAIFLLSLVQSLGSVAIVSLFLLAVRSRFQRSSGS
jgi:hypothetical protein